MISNFIFGRKEEGAALLEEYLMEDRELEEFSVSDGVSVVFRDAEHRDVYKRQVWGNISASSIKKKLVSERKRKCLSAFPFFVLSSFLSA